MVAYKGKDADNAIKYFDTVRGDGTLASPFGSVVVSSDLITVIKPVLTVDTLNYLQNDLLTDKLVLTDAVRTVGFSGYVQSIQIFCNENPASNWAFEVTLFSTNPSTSTLVKNGGMVVANSELDSIIGIVTLGDIRQLGEKWVYQAQNLGLPFVCASASKDIYAVIKIANATITQPVATGAFTMRVVTIG